MAAPDAPDFTSGTQLVPVPIGSLTWNTIGGNSSFAIPANTAGFLLLVQGVGFTGLFSNPSGQLLTSSLQAVIPLEAIPNGDNQFQLGAGGGAGHSGLATVYALPSTALVYGDPSLPLPVDIQDRSARLLGEVSPVPGSAWDVSDRAARALGLVGPAAASAWDVSDRAARALGLVGPAVASAWDVSDRAARALGAASLTGASPLWLSPTATAFVSQSVVNGTPVTLLADPPANQFNYLHRVHYQVPQFTASGGFFLDDLGGTHRLVLYQGTTGTFPIGEHDFKGLKLSRGLRVVNPIATSQFVTITLDYAQGP